MKPSTIATLDKLERVDRFSTVGVHGTEVAVVLSSWDQAIEHCSSVEWENLSIEAMNQYRMRVLERSKEVLLRDRLIIRAKGADRGISRPTIGLYRLSDKMY